MEQITHAHHMSEGTGAFTITECCVENCKVSKCRWAASKPLYVEDLRKLHSPNQTGSSDLWKKVPRYCWKHRETGGPSTVIEEPCLWCYQACTSNLYCAGCRKQVRLTNFDPDFKYEDAAHTMALALQDKFPGIVTNVRNGVYLHHGAHVVGENDIVFDVQLPGSMKKLVVAWEVDGSQHKDMIAGKDAVRALTLAKKCNDSGDALVIFRMRYLRRETNDTNVGETVLLQAQQWMIFIVRNADLFITAQRTIVYHNWEQHFVKVPRIIHEYFAAVETTSAPVPTCQKVSNVEDLTMAKVYEAVTREGFRSDKTLGYKGVLAKYGSLVTDHDAPDIIDASRAHVVKQAAGYNWHNRLAPAGARTKLHAPNCPPQESFVPMQYMATSRAVMDDDMNVWKLPLPLGVYQAPPLTASALQCMAAWINDLDASGPVKNLSRQALDQAAAAIVSNLRLTQVARVRIQKR